LVGDEVFVDHVGQLPFQAAPGFCGGLGLGEFAAIVVAAGSWILGLANGDHVHRRVELTVAGAGESMTA